MGLFSSVDEKFLSAAKHTINEYLAVGRFYTHSEHLQFYEAHCLLGGFIQDAKT